MSMSGPHVSHVTYEQMPAALVADARGSADDAAAARASRTHKHHTRPPGHAQRAGETKVEPDRRSHRGQHRPVTRPGLMNGAPNTPDSKQLERRGAKQPVFDAAEVCGRHAPSLHAHAHAHAHAHSLTYTGAHTREGGVRLTIHAGSGAYVQACIHTHAPMRTHTGMGRTKTWICLQAG